MGVGLLWLMFHEMIGFCRTYQRHDGHTEMSAACCHLQRFIVSKGVATGRKPVKIRISTCTNLIITGKVSENMWYCLTVSAVMVSVILPPMTDNIQHLNIASTDRQLVCSTAQIAAYRPVLGRKHHFPFTSTSQALCTQFVYYYD